ncbi:MAG: ATP-grasp domain-containing protein [Deltaproteobacteria bacterium]|nr:ATP-grasp domain-containing protein [Deltaproteobacteria bacterium]
MKKALILGTLAPQADVVRALQDDGWFVVACGRYAGGPALAAVDRFEPVAVNDIPGVVDLARRERVEFIHSAGSDKALPTIAAASRALGLPTFSTAETVRLTGDKKVLRDCLAASGLDPIRYRRVTSSADLDGWDLFPAIVKPADGSGQRGVFRAHSREEAVRGLPWTLGYSAAGSALVEEFLEGPEVSANCLVVGGCLAFCAVSDRLLLDGYTGGLPRAHLLPGPGTAAAAQVRKLAARVVRAIGLENGPAYLQLKLTSAGPRLLEVAPRLDGCHLWRLIRGVEGVDLLGASLRLLVGSSPGALEVEAEAPPKALTFLRARPWTVFRRAEHPAPAVAEHVAYDYEEGEIVRPVNGYLERVGYHVASFLGVEKLWPCQGQRD